MAVFPHSTTLADFPLPSDRRELENLIEGLIARLDSLDGDPDLEEGYDAECDNCESSPDQARVIDWDCNPIRLSGGRT